jgi:LCP family protein required for cell wall assembly
VVGGTGPGREHWEKSRGFSAFDDEITEVHRDLTAEVVEPAAPAAAPRPRTHWGVATGYTVLALVSLLVLGGTGFFWTTYQNFDSGLNKSTVLDNGPKSSNGDTNILIMGLDSRLDENGQPLDQNLYNALHAGDSVDGGMNSNVLMLLHVPGDGSKATAVSIPRDDYVSLPGCPYQACQGKIKEAYGKAYEQAMEALYRQGVHGATQVQQARDAARKEEIDTVRQFLGGVPIDHFVEVTMVAFFEIAQAVQPVTVCVNENTSDLHYSGADFHQGLNQLSAQQAVAFVRQRRDPNADLDFTALDRDRRQQAFIASLIYQLKSGGTFTDPAKMSAILNVAKANIAVDDQLDLLSFAQQASNLTGGNVTFYTLPIVSYGGPLSDSWNVVNVPLIQSTVHNLLYGSSGGSPAPTATAAAPTTTQQATAVVDVENGSGLGGEAAKVEKALTGNGFTEGTSSNASSKVRHTIVYYGHGASDAASRIANVLGGYNTEPSSVVGAGTVKVVLGSDFSMPAGLAAAAGSDFGSGSVTATSAPPPAAAVNGTAAGAAAPSVNQLSAISGGGIPCVK